MIEEDDHDTGIDLHVDLVSCVPADHVENCEATAGVFVEPSIELESVAFVDDDDVTFVN